MSETFYLCRCQRDRVPTMTLGELRAYEFVTERDGDTTTASCPVCGSVVMVQIDGGTLDLGLVRDEDIVGGFEVFE